MGSLKPLLLIVYICTGLQSFAQQYSFVHYTPKDGLVNSRVRNAYQDSKGRMYFTTYGGLSVFDGARFINYTTQNGLLADLVNDVLEVGDDSLLVATNSCGLNVLVRGQMKRLAMNATSCPVVNKMLKSTDGNIYALTDDGLYKLNSKKLERLPISIPGQNISLILLGSLFEYRDFLIFSTYDANKNEIFLYNKRTATITDHKESKNNGVYSIEAGQDGSVWIGTNEATVRLDTLALLRGKLVMTQARVENNTAILPGGVIHFNNQDELLVSTNNNQVLRYRSNGTVQRIGFPENSVRIQNFFIDRENVIWLCNDGNGIYKLPGIKFQSVSPPFSSNSSGIRSVAGILPGEWWMLMNDGELIRQGTAGAKVYTTMPSLTPYFISNGKRYSYLADARNLYLADPPTNDQKILHLKKIISIPDTAAFGDLYVIDKTGNTILFETRNICVLEGDKLLFTYPLLSADLIQGMHLDKSDRLWVINRYNGLMIFSLHPESPGSYLKKDLHFTTELEKGSPRSTVVDGKNILWVGTRYKGLIGFKLEKDRLRKVYHFQTQDGLTDNFIISLACDNNDNIIIGTQTGLDRLIRTGEGYRVENVTKSNNTFAYINRVWTDSNNNAFAWTNTGDILRIEPPVPEKPVFDPQLLIEEIRINGRSIEDRRSQFRLNHEQRNITFSVAAPSFIDEKQIKYSYLLSGGSNKKWSDTSSTADITFLDLSPGHYTLHIRAFFPSTSYPTKETQFSFFIQPPWWQTWWFRISAAMLVIILLGAGIRFYYRQKLEKQRLALEKQQAIEKERTRIASDMHDDLGAGLSTIRFLSEKVKRNSFSDVTKDDSEKIVANSNELMQKMNEIIWAMNEKNDTLEDLIFYTRSYAMEYCNENHIACETHLPETIPSLFVSGEIRRNVFLTVKESLHNIIKHADAKKVTIDFIINDALAVAINDDGKGFPGDKNKNGNGLRNMKKRIESLGGELALLNSNGVTVKMKVPLPL